MPEESKKATLQESENSYLWLYSNDIENDNKNEDAKDKGGTIRLTMTNSSDYIPTDHDATILDASGLMNQVNNEIGHRKSQNTVLSKINAKDG